MAGRWGTRVGWAIATALAAAVVAWALMDKPIEVDAVPARIALFQKTVDAEGRTRVRNRYVVAAPVAGRLLRVAFKAGDAVAPGATLATIVPSPPSLLDVRTLQELTERVGSAEADLERARAAAERARVAFGLSRSELDRQRELADKGFTSKQTLDRAERDAELKDRELAAARSEEHGAQHQLSLAKAAVARSLPAAPSVRVRGRWTVTAPVGGRVLRVLQESETVVASGAPLVEIGDPDDLEVVADLLTGDAATVAPGATVTFTFGEGAPAQAGRVRLVEPGAFTKVSALGVEEQRVNVVMDFVAPVARRATLGDGYRVDTRILTTERPQALVIPVSALFRSGGAWAVYVHDDGRARMRRVDIAIRNNASAVVESGLREGERIVVYPADTLRDGARVRVREERAPPE